MSGEMQVLVFNISGKSSFGQSKAARRVGTAKSTASVDVASSGNVASSAAVTDDRDSVKDEMTPQKLVQNLNENCAEMAQSIEDEIRSTLPPHPQITVQAELRFYAGSVILAGTVAVLSWAGTIILESVKEELSQVIRVAVQRVMSNVALPQYVEPMEVAVEPVRQSSSRRVGRMFSVQTMTLPSWLVALVIVLLVLVIFLLVDRFFVISPRAEVTADLSSLSVSIS